MKHEAIKKMTIYPDRIELTVSTDDPLIYTEVVNLATKLQMTLDYCVLVASSRSDYRITQKVIEMRSV